jgi:hypothetical protein
MWGCQSIGRGEGGKGLTLAPNRLLLAGSLLALLAVLPSAGAGVSPAAEAFARAETTGRRVEALLGRARGVLHAWLQHADARTLLLPDYLPSFRAGGPARPLLYTPHNSGADNYPYLIATAWFTDRTLYEGRMRDMLRNEIRFTNDAHGLPRTLDLTTGKLGEPYVFGAAEYAKDGLISVTELLGRTPWFYRMVDMTATLMARAAVPSRFGPLPDKGAEINGDLLQTLVRLAAMTGDRRFLEWAERIGDAYVEEILPASHGLPAYDWDFEQHAGPDRLRLRDHGNEIMVGLVLLHALETSLGRPRADSYRPALARMIDRVLASANADGMFYNEIRCSDLAPLDKGISDNWGYIYGAIYTFHMVTGDPKYRDAVLHVLRSLPKYRGFDWERGRQDGYADTIESALYLINREPVPEAIDWIESEMPILLAFQKDAGLVEGAYPDGNWLRTVLLYTLWKTQGTWVEDWRPGVRLGAERQGQTLYVTLDASGRWSGRLRVDRARHRRVMNFDRNYVRLNEWPEWYTVDENTLYEVREATGRVRILLGSDLVDGLRLVSPARLTIRPR